MIDIKNYKTFIFDCDGVVLDSNKVKTEAFYKAALPYGEIAAQQLVEYHVAHGGVSRYKKFAWFLENVVKNQSQRSLEELLSRYASEVQHGLLTCGQARALTELRKKTQKANWLIASGGDEKELGEVFSARKLTPLFNGGIFGSPDTKDVILARELANNNIQRPALFIGDSKYDHLAASNADLDFLFVSGWSEFKDWHTYCEKHGIESITCIADLLKRISD